MSLMMSTGPIAQQGVLSTITIDVTGGPLSFSKEGYLGSGSYPLVVTSNVESEFQVDIIYYSSLGWLTVSDAKPFGSGIFTGPNFNIYVDCSSWSPSPGSTRTARLEIYPNGMYSDAVYVNITQTEFSGGKS